MFVSLINPTDVPMQLTRETRAMKTETLQAIADRLEATMSQSPGKIAHPSDKDAILDAATSSNRHSARK